MEYKILAQIDEPSDIKKLNNDELCLLCAEIRDCMLETVSKNGGHLASNLGSVELTVALHRTFTSPKDTIVFDVGHQSYTHKLLTGRYKQFSTLRKENGISGFTRPNESIHDAFVSGHSSTSVSSAFGVCAANEILNKDGFAIAVIGDGALTGGMCYEALNNVQKKNSRMIVILNDNKMSISKNKGALARHLSTIRTRKRYFKFKSGVERFLIKIPLIGKGLRSFVFHIKLMLKNAIYNSNIFESLGFYYMGPVDGHNIKTLTDMMEIAKVLNRPVLIHTKTIKGKGYSPAETMPDCFHGVSSFDTKTGELPKHKQSFSSVFGETLCEIAEKDSTVCAITAAMVDGTGLKTFSKKFPDRFFDVGIAEEHAVTFSAGLAKSGLKPVFAVYSTFLQRGYDQIIHDCAIEGLPVTFAVDRAGFVGDDGETHQGIFDVAYLSNIPGVKIFAPSTYNELKTVLTERLADPKGVAAIRYPRGSEQHLDFEGEKFHGYTVFGQGNILIATYGTLVFEALNAKQRLKEDNIETAVLKLDVISPINTKMYDFIMGFQHVFFFEEAILNGSVGQRIGNQLLQLKYRGNYKTTAVTDFVKQASVSSQRNSYSLDSNGIVNTVKEVIKLER